MARDITVHIGTFGKGTPQERPAAWVETAITLEPEPRDLMNGIGSRYLRHEISEDDELPGDRPKALPESLTQREILKVYREEVLHYGETVLGMWGDEMGGPHRDACEKWIYEIILDAFPAMRGYEL